MVFVTGMALATTGAFAVARVVRALTIGDIGVAPSATFSLIALAAVALAGSMLLLWRRTRIGASLLLMVPALLTLQLAGGVLWQVSASTVVAFHYAPWWSTAARICGHRACRAVPRGSRVLVECRSWSRRNASKEDRPCLRSKTFSQRCGNTTRPCPPRQSNRAGDRRCGRWSGGHRRRSPGVSAAANIAQAGLADQPTADSVQDLSAATIADPTADPAAPDSDAVSNPDAAPAAGAESAPPEYDATTDISTIPRPSADWPVDVEVWLEQQAIIADCMLEQGYEYVFTPYSAHPPGPLVPIHPENVDGDITSPKESPSGPPDQGLGDAYDWRNAGCHGYAVLSRAGTMPTSSSRLVGRSTTAA